MSAGGLPAWPGRARDSHKGTYGTVLVVGGCAAGMVRMIGAPVLSARGAARTGAGLVRLAMPEPIINAGVALLPSATGVALAVDERGVIVPHEAAATLDAQLLMLGEAGCVVVGPGLGSAGKEERAAAAAVVLRLIQQTDVPVVVDADGLNALAGEAEYWREVRGAVVLTPHPGEFARLAGPLNLPARPRSDEERRAAAEGLAQRVGCVVVLKGAGTVVSDGQTTWTCVRGHPCLATGGTGDVLAGVIAGIAAQAVRAPGMTLREAAVLGVEAHARAGERWARERGAAAGLLAEEVADLIPGELEALRG